MHVRTYVDVEIEFVNVTESMKEICKAVYERTGTPSDLPCSICSHPCHHLKETVALGTGRSKILLLMIE